MLHTFLGYTSSDIKDTDPITPNSLLMRRPDASSLEWMAVRTVDIEVGKTMYTRPVACIIRLLSIPE